MALIALLNQGLRDGNLSVREALAAAGPDDAALLIACEASGCTNVVPRSHVYSMAAVYRCPGYQARAYQCDEEQHFACCHEHAIIALAHCLAEHISAGEFNPVPHASVWGTLDEYPAPASDEPAVMSEAPASDEPAAQQSGV